MEKATNLDQLFKDWQSPPAIYRPQYFWFWNHRMEIAEIKRQIEFMKAAGAGGAFLHAERGELLRI